MTFSFRRSIAAIAAAATAAVGVGSAINPAIAATFGQKEVEQTKFVAVAAPVRNGSAHQLLILEQVSSARPCWSESGNNPVVIDPLLVNFDFTGICSRSTDSNGYSIRMNGQDLGLQYSLRVVDRNGDLLLVGAPSDRTAQEIVIGHAHGSTNGFAKISLDPGWRFTKRVFGDRALGHVYLTYDDVAQNNPTSTPSRFTDTNNDVYRQEIDAAVAKGFIAGFEDNTFRPQASLTREQLVSMVIDALAQLPGYSGPQTVPVLTVPDQVTESPFRDVDASRWSAAKIKVARDFQIVSGYQDGSFRPTQPVTRAELITVLRKAAAMGQMLQGGNQDLMPTQQARSFSDTNRHWASQGINEMSAYCGVASPVNETGNSFAPDTAAQRNYAAAATLRMLNCVDR